MAKSKVPTTNALRALKAAGAEFTVREYKYEEKGGTSVASKALGADEHHVIKTLVFEDESAKPIIVLMHGDRQVSTKNLARELGVKSIQPVNPQTANRHTGYQVGGISPFGTRSDLPVYWEATIAALPKVFINAGKRGLLIEISSDEIARILSPKPVNVAL